MKALTGLIGAGALGLTVIAVGRGWPRAAEPAPRSTIQSRVPSRPVQAGGRPEVELPASPATVVVDDGHEVTPAPGLLPDPGDEPDLVPAPPDPGAALARERADWAVAERELLARIDELEARLADERAMRDLREQEWLDFTRILQALPVSGTPEVPSFLQEDAELEADPAEAGVASEQKADEQRAARRAADRARELLTQLRALLMAEQVVALDFLEVGRVQDGWTGPIVVRLLDDRDRPMGTLAAERLRLEVSRAGRTVTLVLEEGFESHGGVAVPFGPPAAPGARRGGVRRIDVPNVDPAPWIEAFPELIDPDAEEPTVDDGKWNLAYVRTRLNDLLRTDTTGGRWHLRGMGGVMNGVLRDVHLVQLSTEGRVERRLFADHLRLEQHAQGILLRLDGGVQERGGRTAPFLEGRYRIYLPRAKARAWVEANLPGLSPAPGERRDEAEAGAQSENGDEP